MNGYEQRRQKRLQNPAIAAGYREMPAQSRLMRALDEIRKREKLTKEELAERMGSKREALPRLLPSDEANPTLGTFIAMLSALRVTADITLRPAGEGEEPLRVVTEMPAE